MCVSIIDSFSQQVCVCKYSWLLFTTCILCISTTAHSQMASHKLHLWQRKQSTSYPQAQVERAHVLVEQSRSWKVPTMYLWCENEINYTREALAAVKVGKPTREIRKVAVPYFQYQNLLSWCSMWLQIYPTCTEHPRALHGEVPHCKGLYVLSKVTMICGMGGIHAVI